MIRLCGAVLIIFGTSALGILHAARFHERCRVLREWMAVLGTLKTAISYNTCLLPDAFTNMALESEDVLFRNSLKKAAQDLKYGSTHSVSELWENIVQQTSNNVLKAADFSELRRVGMFLGNSDTHDQLEKLNLAIMNLQGNLAQATSDAAKRTTLAGYSGFASGIMLLLLMWR